MRRLLLAYVWSCADDSLLLFCFFFEPRQMKLSTTCNVFTVRLSSRVRVFGSAMKLESAVPRPRACLKTTVAGGGGGGQTVSNGRTADAVMASRERTHGKDNLAVIDI